MNKTFQILAAGVAMAVLCALPAHAQFFGGLAGGQSLSTSIVANTNIVASTNFNLPPSTNATAGAYQIANCRQVVFTIQAAGLTNAAAANAAIAWTRSRDGVSWDSTPFVVLSVAPTTNSYATFYASTNIDMGAYLYITPLWWTNSTYLTNCGAGYAFKPGY